jgi:hypothetical protein
MFLSLLSAFLIGCGGGGGSSSKNDNTTLGDDNNTTDDNTTTDDNNSTTEDNSTALEKFMSDVPVYDDGGKPVTYSYMNIHYDFVSEYEAKALNATLTGVKDFYIYNDWSYDDIIGYSYTPNYAVATKNLSSLTADVVIDGDNSAFSFYLTAQNRAIAYSEIDDIFGIINSSISAVELEIGNDVDVDMSAEHAAYYQQLLDSEVFEDENCSVYEDTSWNCNKYDGTFYYYVDIWEEGIYWYKAAL